MKSYYTGNVRSSDGLQMVSMANGIRCKYSLACSSSFKSSPEFTCYKIFGVPGNRLIIFSHLQSITENAFSKSKAR